MVVGLCYIAKFQRSEMSPGLFQDFMDGYIKPKPIKRQGQLLNKNGWFWDILVSGGYISQKYLKTWKSFFMGREFWGQLKLQVAVKGVKTWKFDKSKYQWKYALYARHNFIFFCAWKINFLGSFLEWFW